MKVPQEIVDKVVQLYKPNYRYLKEAYVDFPIACGIFQLGETEYCDEIQHLTDVETQLCLNQLSYTFFGQGVIGKRWAGLDDLSFDDYLELRKENMFVTESHKKFKREINPKEPFHGEIVLRKMKKHGKLYVAKLDFDINQSASSGRLSLVLKR